jgi:hypothetical protein
MLKSTAERPCAHIKQHLQFRAELAEILRVARFRVSLAALLSFVAASASAQPFPSTLGREGPPAVTDVGWKWDRLDKDTYFYFVGHEGAPLILSVPDAPGDPAPAFNEYLQRYLVDEGYALGVLNWRGDFSRTAKPSDIVSRAFSNFALLRGRNPRRFDPTRIVLFGRDEGAFLAMLLSADTTRLQAAGVPPASICATVLLHPMNLDPTNPDSYLGRRQFLAEPGSLTDVSPSATRRRHRR